MKKARSSSLLLIDKQWLHRGTLALLMTSAVALMVMSKANNPAVTKIRTNISDVMAPMLAVAASPMDAMHNAGQWTAEIVQLRSQNTAMKNERLELLKWQQNAKSLTVENEALRELLHVVAGSKSTYVTARIVADIGGPYVHSALISGGDKDGIQKDQAVINADGLIGRVVEVGESSARVLLINDINSRVPVIIESTGEKSILVGKNSQTPELAYLTADSKVKNGDRIITSGDGGIFPGGIPVGVVSHTEQNEILVKPFTDPSDSYYISVVDYDF